MQIYSAPHEYIRYPDSWDERFPRHFAFMWQDTVDWSAPWVCAIFFEDREWNGWDGTVPFGAV